MADLKPVGSEKLPLDKKLQRIMEIANYGIKPQVKTHNTASLEYTVKAADGNKYGIIRENAQYMILKEGTDGYNYMTGMRNNSRYTFNSYSEALKKLNLLMKPLNENYNGGKQLNLIGEQEEEDTKFVLKQPESEDTGGETEDLGFEDAMDMGGEEETADMDFEVEDDLGGEEIEGEMDVEVTDDEDATKAIQKLTGKLGQKLRDLPEPEMTADIIKYVLNSVISAVDLEKLSSDDKDEIVDKFEDEDIEYTEEGEFDVELSGDEEMDLGDDDMGDMDDMGGEDLDMDLETELAEGMVMGDDEEIDENLGALARMAIGAAAAGFGERAADKVFNEEREMNEMFGSPSIEMLVDLVIKDPKLAMKVVKATLKCLSFSQIGDLVELIDWRKPEHCGTMMSIVQREECLFDFTKYLTSDNFEGATCLLKKLGPDMMSLATDTIGGVFNEEKDMEESFVLAADEARDKGKKRFEFPKGSGKIHPVTIKTDIDVNEEDTINFAGDEEDVEAVSAVADVFNESTVNRTLSKYFKLTPQEKKQKRIRQQRKIEEQKRRKENFLNESIKQVKRKRLVESSFGSYEQERTTKRFLNENKNFNYMGKNKRGGMVFKRNKNLVEITTSGKVL